MSIVLPNRRVARLPNYDYRAYGSYFVTVCTKERCELFGHVEGDQMILNELGRRVAQSWRELPARFPSVRVEDVFVVMPNHFHGIIDIVDPRSARPLGALVGAFKGAVTKHAQEREPGRVVWQRGFYEHVIREEGALEKIRQYIVANPALWSVDRENPQRSGRDPLDELLRECGTDTLPSTFHGV
jgi:REP element-mobilizing transposase RayT